MHQHTEYNIICVDVEPNNLLSGELLLDFSFSSMRKICCTSWSV